MRSSIDNPVGCTFPNTYYAGKLNKLYVLAYLKAHLLPRPKAQNMEGHLTRLEGIALRDIARRYASNGIIVEIGSYLGKSSNYLAGALTKGGHLYCIDPWFGEGGWIKGKTGKETDTYNQFLSNMKSWTGKFTALRGYSTDVVKNWTQQIDLLWIDGDHTYEGCSSDIMLWYPFLKKDGWICLHDYDNPFGVKQAVQDILFCQVNKYYLIDSMFVAQKGKDLK